MSTCKKTLSGVADQVAFLAKCLSEIKEIEILAHSNSIPPHINNIEHFRHYIDAAVCCLTEAKKHLETAMGIE